MGSGPRFRFQAHRSHNAWYFQLGLAVIPKAEHQISIHLSCGFHSIYIGIGKGYDE